MGLGRKGSKTGHLEVGLFQGSGPFEGEKVVLLAANVNVKSDLPIGGRLAYFADCWNSITSDSWVRDMVRSGLSLEFVSTPPRFFISYPFSKDAQKKFLMDSAVHHLLNIRAIQRVPEAQSGTGFYSLLFLVPKS